MSSSYYAQAAVCRRGHVQTRDTQYGEVTECCPRCGAKVLTTCPACNHRLRGDYVVPGVISASSKKPPLSSFCDSCGSALPWADRKARIYELQNTLDDAELDSATELAIREQLEALTNADLDEADQITRWQRIKSAAPDLFGKITTHPVFVQVASAEARKQLGLPPA